MMTIRKFSTFLTILSRVLPNGHGCVEGRYEYETTSPGDGE